MKIKLTIDDLPTDKASCANCTNNGIFCERKQKRYPDGHIKSATGEIAGIICRCVNYEGKYSK